MSEPAPDSDERPTRSRTGRRSPDLSLVPDSPVAPEPPSGAVLHPPARTEPARRGFFLTQLWTEFLLVLRMYFDHRYRISRTAQIAVPGIFVLFCVNYFLFNYWFPVVPVFTPVVERLICVVLGITLYKMLARELSRYREVLDYLPRYGGGG